MKTTQNRIRITLVPTDISPQGCSAGACPPRLPTERGGQAPALRRFNPRDSRLRVLAPLLLATLCFGATWTERLEAASETGQTRDLKTVQDREAADGKSKPDEPLKVEGQSVSGLKVSLLLEGRPKGKPWQKLQAGASLRSGDDVRTKVKLSAPAYVYVVQFFPDDTAAFLFPPPPETQRRVPAGELITLPDPGWTFSLDNHPGQEHVYVIASVRPLKEVDEALVAALDQVRYSGNGAPSPEVDPPTATGVSVEVAPADSAQSNTSGEASREKSDEKPVEKPTQKPKEQPKAKPQKKPGIFAAQKPKEETLVAVNSPARLSKASIDMNTRGINLKQDPEAKDVTLVYAADKDGVAVLHFELKHLP